MKKSTKILLLLLLLVLLIGCSARGLTISGYNYDHANRYNVGGGAISGKVGELDINWIAGNVTIGIHDGDEVVLSEKADRRLKEAEELHWWLDGDKLYVKYAESGYKGSSNLNKQLTVLLPEGLKLNNAVISVVSANVQAEALTAENTKVNTVSGDVEIGVADAEHMNVNTVSGNVAVNAKRLDEINAESVSGSLRISYARMPERIEADTVSGDVVLLLPENAGFTAELDSVSGDVSGNMPMVLEGKDRYVGGNGACRISVDSVSGDLRLDVLDD